MSWPEAGGGGAGTLLGALKLSGLLSLPPGGHPCHLRRGRFWWTRSRIGSTRNRRWGSTPNPTPLDDARSHWCGDQRSNGPRRVSQAPGPPSIKARAITAHPNAKLPPLGCSWVGRGVGLSHSWHGRHAVQGGPSATKRAPFLHRPSASWSLSQGHSPSHMGMRHHHHPPTMSVLSPRFASSAARYMPAGPAPTTATSYSRVGVAALSAEAMLGCALSGLRACGGGVGCMAPIAVFSEGFFAYVGKLTLGNGDGAASQPPHARKPSSTWLRGIAARREACACKRAPCEISPIRASWCAPAQGVSSACMHASTHQAHSIPHSIPCTRAGACVRA